MSSPRDIKMTLPDGGRIPRVGKLRLGIKVERMKDDKPISFPSAVDYFVVNEDASTNRQSAESFHAVYGDEPREIDIVLPAPTTEDVLEGAWRSYGTGGKLKRKCTGPGGSCVERDDAGDWLAGACACEREKLPLKITNRRGEIVANPAHCAQRWTLTVMLMRVAGVGCWQLDTGSVMAAEGLTASLRMLEQFRGHLQGAKATLRVVPRQVAPDGKAKTVYIAELGSLDITPQQALQMAAENASRVALPASSLDDETDPLLDHPALIAGEVIDGDAHPFPNGDESRPFIPKGGLKKALEAMNAQQRGELFRECGITMKDGKVTPPLTIKQIADTLWIKWASLRLADDQEGDPVPGFLLNAIKAARPEGSAEAFDIHLETGQNVNPGDQVALHEEGVL